VVVGISLLITTVPANLYALAPKSVFSADDESVRTRKVALEKIERAGVAMRGMIHGMRKYMDAPNYLADAFSLCEMVKLPESAQHLKPKLHAITGAITNCYQSLKQGVFQTTEASIKENLNASDAEACAKTLQTILVKVREENEKLNKLYQDSALSNNKPILERLDVIRSHLAIITEILQSRIEIVLGIKPKDLKSTTEIIKEISSIKEFETVKVENDASSSLQFNGNRLSFIGALSNVIKNAQHFANKRAEKSKMPANVGIRVSQENSFVRMDITDNGEGIEPELLEIDPVTGRPKLFNINVSRREKGTGLGTTEAWYVIRDAGGTIEVDSLTEDEYQKFKLPSTFKDERQQWIPETKSLIKEHYPQIEAQIENLIKLLNTAEAGNIALLDNIPRSGLKIKPFEHILGNTIAIAQGCVHLSPKSRPVF